MNSLLSANHHRIINSLNDEAFFHSWRTTSPDEWESVKTNQYLIKSTSYSTQILVHIKNEGWFIEEYGCDWEGKDWSKLVRVIEEVGDAIYAKISHEADPYDAVTQECDESEEARRKEAEYFLQQAYIKRCKRIAQRYGIRNKIAIYCFHGDNESVKKFAITLNRALKKPYNAYYLSDSDHQKDEIKRLKIDIGDATHISRISQYILECLKAGKVVR